MTQLLQNKLQLSIILVNANDNNIQVYSKQKVQMNQTNDFLSIFNGEAICQEQGRNEE